ncbi:hypothetical protein A0H81_04443 [Grifola frondosa]|uniref:Zn(2)-C6 fungal-type domain-containing protein n=1 Tax=Grifola frondosa TaxID=5627 RepID=A0A1C7MHL9_GRIFR|nr:hypothetical protein A0H81_04443 [Grifola frondosa]
MSPKNPSPAINRASSGEPYPSRRASGQPKSTRQQYSACGACRMRRVRCDLKDLPILGSGQHPPCSNCSERGLNCVDEFAEVKAVKLLRRGRRLQKVEAVYGKTPKDEVDLHSVTPPRSVIPQLKPEFFRSPFFRRFHVQRPIIEPAEFCARFNEFAEGNTEYLDVPGQLVALALVVWAASYGVNEYGVEDTHEGPADIRKRKELVNQMLDEFLYLIDIHGILRKPSWDGVRVLLLIMPLTQDAQSPMDRLAMYDATLSQVYSLCSLASSSSVDSGQGSMLTPSSERVSSGRLSLTEDDLKSFETTLPSPHSLHDNPAAASYSFTYRFATIPIHIASVCRAIHSALTGPKARREDDVDESKLQYAWDTLERCWNDFDGLRRYGTAGIVQAEDVERFIDAWQIFVFECHNVIREGLKQRPKSQV